MKIAFDVSYIQHKRAGYGRASEALLRALLASDNANEYILHGWSMSLDDETIRSFVQPGVRLSTMGIPGPIKRFYWNSMHFPDLQSFTGEFDIFHGAEPFLPPTEKAAGIVTIHDLSYLKFPEFFTPSIRRWDAHVRANAQRSDAIIVPSENSKIDVAGLLNIEPQKIFVVPTPSDNRFSPVRQSDSAAILKRYGLPDQYILYVGTIEPRKNIPGLVRAYEELRRRRNNVPPLVVIGKTGWLAEPSLAAINGSPARPHIITPGYTADADLPEIFRHASMFVFPSFYEGFGLPVREAMASGVPVVTSDNSSLRELCRNAALLVDPSSPSAIAEAMDILHTDATAAARLRAQGLARAGEFTAAKSVATVLSIYNRIGEKRR